jgi:hypothetical protein
MRRDARLCRACAPCNIVQEREVKIPEPPWGSGGGVRRSGFPECSRFISELELELEEEEGLVWSSTAFTLVAFRDASFSATRSSTQLSGAFLNRDWMPSKLKSGPTRAHNLEEEQEAKIVQ